MRWLILLSALAILTLAGCERIQRGEVKVAVHSPAPPKALVKKVKPIEEKPAQPETLAPEQPSPETAQQTTPQQPMPEPTAAQPQQLQPTPSQTTTAAPTATVKSEIAQQPQPTITETIALNFADEARSARASADALHSQFDKLPVSEIRSRLLLLNQAISELEVRSPALVLWRTALRLEVMSKSPYPDVSAARTWLAKAREILAEQKIGLTALSNAESSLKTGDWKSAANALREAANRLKVSEQAEALTQARICLLNALEALERQKNSVAKAEVGEAVKALDRFIATLQ